MLMVGPSASRGVWVLLLTLGAPLEACGRIAPRHVLAAAVWAHERDPDATATFTEILQHFLL